MVRTSSSFISSNKLIATNFHHQSGRPDFRSKLAKFLTVPGPSLMLVCPEDLQVHVWSRWQLLFGSPTDAQMES
jgi:hypothetical protein